jgi:hypothetical protein
MWTPLNRSLRCRTWKERPGTNGTTKMTDVSNLLLMWRIDETGRLRYLDAYGDDVQAVLCFAFEP